MLRQWSRLIMKVQLHWLRVRNLVLGGLNQEEGDVTGFKSPMRKGKSVGFFGQLGATAKWCNWTVH